MLLSYLVTRSKSVAFFNLSKMQSIKTKGMVCCSFVVFKHLWLELLLLLLLLLQRLVKLASIAVESELS